MKNIVLVGLGPHARRIYYPFLEKHQSEFDISIPLIIELEDQRSAVQEFMAERILQPHTILYLDPTERLGQTLSVNAKDTLDDVMKNYNDVHMIIATEPKAHLPYAQYALRNNIDA